MDRARIHQGLRRIRFTDVLDRTERRSYTYHTQSNGVCGGELSAF